ncbi:MAG: YbaN family protein [Oscillospiraceae bacterium]|jgi:uncharacterized membrane protein YbaN (DUF454 family)|nr:YbaN family protein [Oscillospiraceae bacterium]
MKKILLMIGGGVCLAMAVAGLFLPLWPTTPFVLLAAACFSGYPAVYARIRRIRFFREYLDAFKNNTPIPASTRRKSIGALWVVLVLSMIIKDDPLHYWLLPLVGVGVTIHLLTIGRGKKNP